VYPRPWHAVLQRFQQELSSLRTFLLTADEYDEWFYRRQFGYLVVEPGHHHLDDGVGNEAEDDAALQSLMSAMESRRSLNP
jgi:hypothetical protein